MEKAPRNRTITLSDQERADYRQHLLKIAGPTSANSILNRVINQDLHHILNWLPSHFIDPVSYTHLTLPTIYSV